jgi:hypothetical protein
MKRKILLTAVLLFSIHIYGQETNIPTHDETINFIEHSIRDFKKADPAGEIPVDLKQFYGWFQNDMATCEKQNYFELFLQKITDNYKKLQTFANLKFITNTSGAIIKFQTVLEKTVNIPPRQADNPTNNCQVKLAPGQYYIWAEREGKITSDSLRKVYIKLDTSAITINEK